MKKIINIAHRGFTRNFPDNTLEAFEAALKLGVDGIEFDVQETADNEFFIFHDDTLDGKAIAKITATEMREARVQSNYKVPTLEEVLCLLGHDLILIVELKQVRSLEKFLKILRSYADVTLVVIVSFDRGLVAKLADLAPDIMRAVITDAAVEHAAEITQSTSSAAIGMRCRYLNGESISKLHADGIMVFVWDCVGADSFRRAMKYDIDGVISDVPDLVKEQAGRLNS